MKPATALLSWSSPTLQHRRNEDLHHQSCISWYLITWQTFLSHFVISMNLLPLSIRQVLFTCPEFITCTPHPAPSSSDSQPELTTTGHLGGWLNFCSWLEWTPVWINRLWIIYSPNQKSLSSFFDISWGMRTSWRQCVYGINTNKTSVFNNMLVKLAINAFTKNNSDQTEPESVSQVVTGKYSWLIPTMMVEEYLS